MQAVVFERTGPAEQVLALRDVPIADASAGEVVVKVLARCIQPADLMFIAGRYRVQPRLPQTAGFDGAGVVTAVREGIEGLASGQRVAFRSPGAWAEFAAVPAARLRPVPAHLSASLPDELVCQFALNPPTAWGLLDMGRAVQGARILATAGRSTVVRILAALARRRSLELQRLAREDGGYVLLHGERNEAISRGATVAEALKGQASFDVVLDAVGGPTTLDLVAATTPGGRLISYGVLDDRPFEFRAATVLYRNLLWQGFGIDAWTASSSPETLTAAMAECWTLLASEPELLPVAARFGLKDFRLALDAQRRGSPAGKVVLL
jgi:NADPH:quinone reductase-like Zn-dependent oxidoreductase